MNEKNVEQHICEYCDCNNVATVWDENLQAWLCDEHDGGRGNSTGYCNQQCQLGYGCDGSCCRKHPSQQMKRSGFKRTELPKQHTIHHPIKAGVFASASGMAQPVPKTEPKRNPALLAMARGRECLLLAPGVDFHDTATVVACHSNLSIHGKAGARKADDHYSVWGCAECHRWLDQGRASAETKEAVFTEAHKRQWLAWWDVTTNMLEERKTRDAAQWALDQLN